MAIRIIYWLSCFTFASIFIHIITRSLREFAVHRGRMRGKNFIWLSLFIASKAVFFNLLPDVHLSVGTERGRHTESPLLTPPSQGTAEQSLGVLWQFYWLCLCRDSHPWKWCFPGVSAHGCVRQWWIVDTGCTSFMFPSVPQASDALCQGCCWTPHVTQTDVPTLLLMGTADTTHLEISVPASQINTAGPANCVC